jgi:hypothetical protein
VQRLVAGLCAHLHWHAERHCLRLPLAPRLQLFWQVARAGGPPLAFNAGGQDFPATTKGSHWKASYHTGRALLRLQQAGVL